MESTPPQSSRVSNIRPRFQRSPSPPHVPNSPSCLCSICFIDERVFPRTRGRNITLPPPQCQVMSAHDGDVGMADVPVARDVVRLPPLIHLPGNVERDGDVRMTDVSVARSVGLPPGPSRPQNRAAHYGDVAMADVSMERRPSNVNIPPRANRPQGRTADSGKAKMGAQTKRGRKKSGQK